MKRKWKTGTSNGIYEVDGKYFIMCGDEDVPIDVKLIDGRVIYHIIKRTPRYIPQRTPK